jgi:hypothetical protein
MKNCKITRKKIFEPNSSLKNIAAPVNGIPIDMHKIGIDSPQLKLSLNNTQSSLNQENYSSIGSLAY